MRLVCSYIHFSFTDVQAVTNSHYGKPRKPVHLSNVQCSGMEEQILSCTHTEFISLNEKLEALNESNVAGVICQSTTTSESLASSGTPSSHITTSAPVDQNADGLPTNSLLLVIPIYFMALVMTLGLILATVYM